MDQIIYYSSIVCCLFYYAKYSFDEEIQMRKIESQTEIKNEYSSLKFNSNHSDYLYYSSHLGIIPTLYGVYNGSNLIALTTGLTLLTSLNYWRNPRYTWRRTIDVHMSRFTVLYNIYHTMIINGDTINYMYIPSMSSCVLLYPIGIYLYNRKQYWYFVAAHMGVHISATVATMLSISRKK